jgi:hypothetical protein
MRPAQKSNRSRGRGNRKGGGGGNNVNRVYDSAGPEGKVRGTPQQIIDKYLTLARDAQTSGDRVAAENFLQHAEHYQRILITAAAAQEQSRKESQEAATDQREAQQPDPAAAEQPAPVEQPAPAEQPVASADQATGGSPGEIGGMAMIDAGTEAPELLVESEDPAQSQPRRNGDGRRKRGPAPEKAPVEAEASDPPEASAES